MSASAVTAGAKRHLQLCTAVVSLASLVPVGVSAQSLSCSTGAANDPRLTGIDSLPNGPATTVGGKTPGNFIVTAADVNAAVAFVGTRGPTIPLSSPVDDAARPNVSRTAFLAAQTEADEAASGDLRRAGSFVVTDRDVAAASAFAGDSQPVADSAQKNVVVMPSGSGAARNFTVTTLDAVAAMVALDERMGIADAEPNKVAVSGGFVVTDRDVLAASAYANAVRAVAGIGQRKLAGRRDVGNFVVTALDVAEAARFAGRASNPASPGLLDAGRFAESSGFSEKARSPEKASFPQKDSVLETAGIDIDRFGADGPAQTEAERRPVLAANGTYMPAAAKTVSTGRTVGEVSPDRAEISLDLRWSPQMDLGELAIRLYGLPGWDQLVGMTALTSHAAFFSDGPSLIDDLPVPAHVVALQAPSSSGPLKSARLQISYSGEFSQAFVTPAQKAGRIASL